MKRSAALIVPAVFVALAGPVQGQSILDFNEIINPVSVGHLAPYLTGDYQLSTNGYSFGSHGYAASIGYAGSQGLFNNQDAAITTLSRQDGGLFNVFSIDFAHYVHDGYAGYPGLGDPITVSVTGFYFDDTSFTQNLSIGFESTPWFQAYALGAEFQNIKQLDFSPQNYPYYQFDCIEVEQGANRDGCAGPRPPQDTVTPEPVTMTLLGTGLAGIAAARRRRKNA